MLDEENNPVAQQFDSMIEQSERAHRKRVVDQMQQVISQPTPPVAAAASVPMPPTVAPGPPQAAVPANDYWFLNQPSQPMQNTPQDMVTFNTQVVAPGTPPAAAPATPVASAPATMDEQQLLAQLRAQDQAPSATYSHLHTIQPLSQQNPRAAVRRPAPATNTRTKSAEPPVTPAHNAAILDLVSNNDLNVATIAREAHKRQGPPPDEVVISLH
jgi:hypothetical protein